MLVVSLEGKVKSRAKLLDLEEQGADVGLPQSQSFQSFPINAQPMFAARAPAVLPKDEVVLSRNRNKMQQQHQQHDDYDRIESLVQELDRAQSPLEDEINQQMISRDKKSKADAAAETAPLASHRRKNFFDKDNSASGSVKTCPSQMNVQASTILDSKTSIQKGAKFLRVEYIELQSAKKGLNFVQDECKRLCCEDSVCDTSLLAMKLNNNDNRYRCYLYECQDLCSMVPHKDYYVFMVKDAEQSQIPAVEKPSSAVGQGSNDITTGHDHGDAHNFDMSVDTFQNSLVSPEPSPNYSDKLKLSDEDRAYFFDKSLASKSSIAMAVIILILGICLVIAFFLYLVVNTKFIAKRIKWIGGGKKLGKNNLDVEADYLINGMYL